MLQALKFGVSAVTADGRDVGTLFRVVMDERVAPNGQATYLVIAVTVQRRLIESGNLLKPGGWDKPRDLLVSFASVTGADEDEVRLALTEEEFLALPPYIIGAVPEPDEQGAPPGFAAQDAMMRVGAALGGGPYEQPHDELENRPPTARHLSHGVAVWQRAPHRHIGDVDRVLMDDVSNLVTGLVVRQGVLFTHDVVVPADYIAEVLDDLVHVDIPAAEQDALQEYRSEE